MIFQDKVGSGIPGILGYKGLVWAEGENAEDNEKDR